MRTNRHSTHSIGDHVEHFVDGAFAFRRAAQCPRTLASAFAMLLPVRTPCGRAHARAHLPWIVGVVPTFQFLEAHKTAHGVGTSTTTDVHPAGLGHLIFEMARVHSSCARTPPPFPHSTRLRDASDPFCTANVCTPSSVTVRPFQIYARSNMFRCFHAFLP